MPTADPPADSFVRLCHDLRVLVSLWSRAARGTTMDDRFAARLFYGLLARRTPCFRPLGRAHYTPMRAQRTHGPAVVHGAAVSAERAAGRSG